MSRLNSENAQLKLQTKIDLANLEGAGTALDKIKVQYESVSKQIEIANNKVLIMKRNLEDTQKNNAAEPVQRSAQRQLLEQQLNLSKLQAEQRRLASLGGAGGAGKGAESAFKRLAVAAKEAGGGVSGLVQSFASMNPQAAIGVTAVAAVGAKIVSLTKEAADAAASIGDLGDQLGIGTEEAAKLQGTLKAAGVSTDGFISWITRLDKSIMSAGAGGNETTRMLERFGVSLTDETGKLVDYNEQLRRLAEAFQNAKAAGKVEEFLAGMGRGAAQYRDLFNKLESDYRPRGLEYYSEPLKDAAQASMKLTDDLKHVDEQLDALKLAFGAAFIPVANEMIPPVIDLLHGVLGIINENKAALSGFARTVATIAIPGMGIAEMVKNAGLLREKLSSNAEEFVSNADLDKAAQSAAKRRETEARASEQARREQEAEATARKQSEEKLQSELSEIRLQATETDLEKSLRAIDKRNKELKEKYAEGMTSETASLIDETTEAQKAKVMQDFNNNTVAKINEIWQTGLEKRLADIEREKEAWKQKGIDEVAASKWAEQAKIDAVVNRNRAVMTQEREALNAYLTGGIKGLEAYQMKKDDYIGQLDAQTLNAFDAAKKAVLQKMYGGGLSAEGGTSGGMDALKTPVETTANYTKALYDYVTKGIVTEVKSMPVADISQGINASEAAWNSAEIQNYLNDGQLPGAGAGQDPGAGMEIIRGTQKYQVGLDGIEREFADMRKDMEVIRGTESSYSKINQAGGKNQGMSEVNQSLQRILSKMDVNKTPSDIDINVNIDTAVTEDSAGMTKLADAVADKITPHIESVLGRGSNGY